MKKQKSYMNKVIIMLVVISVLQIFLVACLDSTLSIDQERFPDDALRGAVSKYDSNSDSKLSSSELSRISSLTLDGCNDLTGIELLSNLKSLTLYNSSFFYEFSLNQKSKIEDLQLINCSFDSGIALNNCSTLKSVNFEDCIAIGKVDLSDCSGLEKFRGGINTEILLLCNCSKLKDASCTGSESLTSVNINGCGELTVALFNYNKNLKEIDIGGCPQISMLQLDYTGLEELNIIDNSIILKLVEKTPEPIEDSRIRYKADGITFICDSDLVIKSE